ncbi:MAG: phenyltransferase domain-containing protein [Syntrophales bacterium]
MELPLTPTAEVLSINVPATAEFIASLQKDSGEIPWSRGGKTDPWDHVESAMGLAVAGYHGHAERAYEWLAATQLRDGSWWSATRDGAVEDETRDSNVSSYVAVGVYHHYLSTGDAGFLKRLWPTVERGVGYAVSLQAESGVIHWARNGAGAVDPMALLTGSSSVFMSLKCALAVARILGKRRADWETAAHSLGMAIRLRPSLFNMMKSRYSMDWYYPILCGAVTGGEARARIDRGWEKFVMPDWGVRCVSDQPWVTTAEAAELVLALTALGESDRAAIVFNWVCDKRYDDGSYWTGVTVPGGVVWPEERTSWTAAAVLLAYDALCGLTPASRLFSHASWREAGIGQLPAGGSDPDSRLCRGEPLPAAARR